MNTIPTPRTDAVQFKDRSDYHDPSAFDWFVRAEHARTLERELAELISVNATGAARLAYTTAQLAAEREAANQWKDSVHLKGELIDSLLIESNRLHAELAVERKKTQMLRSVLERRHDEQSYYCKYVDDALAATLGQ